jgi:NAD(P)-dependent dehydrogenase (short-subunit alcohol dehydrogenase family)
MFGAKSTTDEVLAGQDLKGKRFLVTGVSAGLGVETARVLVGHGADVIGTARDLAKAERATKHVRDAAWANGGTLGVVGIQDSYLAVDVIHTLDGTPRTDRCPMGEAGTALLG